MKTLVITSIIVLKAAVSFTQPITIKWNENQGLQWEDFLGKINDTSRFDAECFTQVSYNYTFYDVNDFEFEVYAHFDKSTSWKKGGTQSKALLKHEQLHFDIAHFFANKLKYEFENFHYTNNYQEEIKQLFNKQQLEYKLMQHTYDQETCHSLNKEKQMEWENYIFNEINSSNQKFQLAKTSKKFKVEGE